MVDVISNPPERRLGANSQLRWVNLLLAIWLFISAFLWPHSQAQMTNTWIMGLVCAVCAVLAMAVPLVRYVNTAASVWLFISAFALPVVSRGTVWNNALVAIAIFFISLSPAPGAAEIRTPSRRIPI